MPDHRKRPRRRGAALHTAILEATMAELADVGYAGLTVERVAERAAASKASLYRRWPSKVELVMDAVYYAMPDPETAHDTGSLRGDLLAMLREAADQLDSPVGHAMRGIVSDALRDEGRARQIREHTRGASRRAVLEIVRRADDRGELDAAAVTERQVETAHALLRFHFLTGGTPIPDDVIVGIVDEVLLPLLQQANSRRTSGRPA